MSLLERDDILDALRELARRLADAGVVARVRIVGGAALAIEYFDRAATNDVDAFISPAADVNAAAAEVAQGRGWPEDWLNNKVVMFMSRHDERATWKPIVAERGVVISVASADPAPRHEAPGR